MTELLDVVHALGRWSWAAVWLPLLAWTLLALPIYTLLRYTTDRWHPLVQYRLLQALLFALPVGCAAAAWLDASALAHGLAALLGTVEAPGGQIVLPLAFAVDGVIAATHDAPSLDLYHATGALTGVATLLGAVRLIRLGQSALAMSQLHAPHPACDAHVQTETDRLAAAMGIRRPVAVRHTTGPSVPMTHGFLRPTILLPASLTARPDALRMTLTHELVHIRRGDFLARGAEQLLVAAFAIHPGVAHLAAATESAREIACDTEALRRMRCSRRAYADLLCGFATPPHHRSAFALSIAESSSLKQRIHAMTMLDRFTNRTPRYTPLLAATLIAVLGLGIVACSDTVMPPTSDDASEDPAVQQSEALGDDVHIKVDNPPELVGGMAALQERIEYPEFAKKAGIEGRVFVQFVIDEEGNVQNPQVTRGVHELLDRAAVEAIEGITFEPGMHNGEPVKVQFALPITFRLPSEDASEDAGSGE